MKNLFICILFVSMAGIVGCSKTDSGTNNNGNGGGGNATDYMPLTNGSSWHYTTPTGTLTRTVDGTASYLSKTYTALVASNGDSLSLRADGSIMYQIMPKDLLTPQEVVFLNTSVGATWSYDMNVFFATHVDGKTIEAGLTRVVNGKTYTDVLHIQNTVSVSGFGGGLIDIYFAKGVGEIETVDPSGDKSETLDSYEIK